MGDLLEVDRMTIQPSLYSFSNTGLNGFFCPVAIIKEDNRKQVAYFNYSTMSKDFPPSSKKSTCPKLAPIRYKKLLLSKISTGNEIFIRLFPFIILIPTLLIKLNATSLYFLIISRFWYKRPPKVFLV